MSVLVLLVSFAFYLHGASPSIAPRDSADMASAALTLGVAHPPGYPLYAVLGKVWITIFPIGDPAYRLAVLSSIAGSFAVLFLFLSVRRRSGLWAGLTAAAVLLFSAPLWKFSLIQEKYSLHLLFVSALLYLAEGESAGAERRFRLSSFLFGLGLVNHQSLLLWSPAFFLLWRKQWRLQTFIPCAVAGLSLYAFLWVRLGSFQQFLATALRSQYGSGTLAPGLTMPFTPERAMVLVGWSLKTWALAVSLPAAAAALAGLWMSEGENRTRAWILLLGAFLAGPLFVVLSRFDSASWVARSVLEPAFLIPALAAAALAGEAAARAGRYAPAACAALAACALALRAPVPDRRDDFLALDYVRSLRRAVPPGGALLAGGDTALFGLRWLELTEPRTPAREVAGAGLVDARAWLASRAGRSDIFVTGVAPRDLAGLGLGTKAVPLSPEGLVQRVGAVPRPWPDAPVLRRSGSWERDESYARDAKLSYAFASWAAARVLEAQGIAPPEALDLAAVVLDPADYSLE